MSRAVAFRLVSLDRSASEMAAVLDRPSASLIALSRFRSGKVTAAGAIASAVTGA